MLKGRPLKFVLILESCLMLVTAQMPTVSHPDDYCEPNKKYYQCMPCTKVCGKAEPVCQTSCRPACYCKPGYVLTSLTSDTCILESQCGTCGPNGRFDNCSPPCQATCANYLQRNQPCAMMCSPSCICNSGYVLHKGTCILPTQCPTNSQESCPANQVWKEYGTACPLNCQNFENPPEMCMMVCKTGCFCKGPYVFQNGTSGPCVLPRHCPPCRG
ncbi:zonadhesin-like [Xenopus tropicalis]|uniref:Zonadhesin-like n=1 Tax=Xenopus tropicalis TaxID=8364 RepID=A0A8J1JUZ2_XENTR|nr:zonadhesin-like [Xenopus tropicalis]